MKDLGPDAYLLNKNIIRSNNEELNAGAKAILKQKPNRKILGLFRFHLGVYNLANQGRQSKFKKWIKKTIGEEPVVLDTNLTDKSRNQVELYLQNEGYFNATVTDSTVYKRRKRANVIYTIHTGDPYTLRQVNYEIHDKVIEQILINDTVHSEIKSGEIYKTSALSAERDRVTKLLRNMGYYEFSPLYITYEIDSALKSNQADVTFILAAATSSQGPGDTTINVPHKVYRINNVYIVTDYDPLSKSEEVPSDTTVYKNYFFLSKGSRLQYKPEAISSRVYLEKGSLYKINNADFTYKGLANLSLFKFVNIRFEKVESDTAIGNWLDSRISLSPSPRQDYRVEVEGTHNGGNFGIGGNFTYRNKNVFRGAESFELKLKAKAESIPDFTDEAAAQVKPLSLNTYEFGPELTIRIPRFLWPLKKFNKNRSANPVSLISVSYNYQKRPEYIRNLLLLTGGIEFRETRYKRHYVYPAEINYSNFNLSPAFENKLNSTSDQKLLNYYRKYLITNGRYTFVYNSQEQNLIKNFFFFRFTVEFAGNSLRLVDRLFNSNYSDTTSFEILGIPYSQYIRPDADLRFYQVFSENSSIIYRVAGGLGIAYLNSSNVPYEKTFFAGGVNDLRAFKARTVGPGSYDPAIYIEQLGDLKINFNIEYRSDIFKILEGAVFLDAGNIWLLKDNPNQPGGKFEPSRFLGELALGTGIGFRLDFNFFIFRVDAGIPLRDPAHEKNDRWVIQYFKPKSVNYNFGIGYPF